MWWWYPTKYCDDIQRNIVMICDEILWWYPTKYCHDIQQNIVMISNKILCAAMAASGEQLRTLSQSETLLGGESSGLVVTLIRKGLYCEIKWDLQSTKTTKHINWRWLLFSIIPETAGARKRPWDVFGAGLYWVSSFQCLLWATWVWFFIFWLLPEAWMMEMFILYRPKS